MKALKIIAIICAAIGFVACAADSENLTAFFVSKIIGILLLIISISLYNLIKKEAENE